MSTSVTPDLVMLAIHLRDSIDPRCCDTFTRGGDIYPHHCVCGWPWRDHVFKRSLRLVEMINAAASSPAESTATVLSVRDRLGVDCRLGAIEDDGPIHEHGYGHGV